MGTRLSRLDAWTAVRGNPSRMKDAEGLSVGTGEERAEPATAALGEDNHPFDVSSEDINSKIVLSETSLPDWIEDSTLRPIGVLFLTLSRNRSPELIDANWGYRLIKRSV